VLLLKVYFEVDFGHCSLHSNIIWYLISISEASVFQNAADKYVGHGDFGHYRLAK